MAESQFTSFDIDSEEPISMAEVAEMLPRKPNGKRISALTVLRYAKYGHKGIPLQAMRVGKLVFSSRESVKRFIKELNSPLGTDPSSRTSNEHSAAQKSAETELQASGW